MRIVCLVAAAALVIGSSPALAAAPISTAPKVSGTGDSNAKRVTSVPPAGYRPAAPVPKAAAALVAPGASAHRIQLPDVTNSERASMRAKNASRNAARARTGKTVPLQIGFPREVPAANRRIVLSDLAWQALPDGSRAARIEIQSPGAAALRLSLALPATHADMSLRFRGNGPRAEVIGPVAANAVAEATLRDDRYWSPVLEGDTAVIEFHVVNGATFGGAVLTLGPASHLLLAGPSLQRVDAKRVADIGDADTCNIDFACVTPPSTPLTQASNSVGKLVFNDRAGSTFLCTGTMLSDTVASFTPYMLSASHCFDEAFLASTVNVYWFFKAQSCDSLEAPPYVLQGGGSFLLARSEDYDWALLRLNREPPAGVFFSAWRAEPVPQLAIGTDLHHPQGDLLMFTQGTSPGYRTFDDGSSFISMQWSQGTTETGSSGSALFTFLQPQGYYEVRGGLFGGDASCSNRAGLDYFSRMDNMLPLTRQYLTPDAANPTGQAVVVEYYARSLDHYFITIDPNEINVLDTGMIPGWERTGLRFLAYSGPAPGANPVCRFYMLPEFGDSHFYSANPAECEATRQRFGHAWFYESPNVFYIQLPVAGICPSDTRPVWRFLNTVTTNHRYVTEVTIRDALRANPIWVGEGDGPDVVTMCSPVSN